MEENSKSSSSIAKDTHTDKATSTVPTNEESLRISTSSSWTILPPDRIDILENTSGSEESSAANSSEEQKFEQQPEQLSSKTSNNEHLNERCKLIEESDTQAEDVSDGISIISDCESTGRISPHPFLRDHLSGLNFKYESGMDLPLPDMGTDQQLRERRHTPLGYDDAATQSQQTSTDVAQPGSEALAGLVRLPAIVQTGLTAVFYVGATLAILAFVGRLRNPEWQPIGNDRPLTELEQRMIEMELQNNLMRAEIDIMSKQVQYLNNLASGQGPGQSNTVRKGKTFKVWSGNGNSMDPIDITKEDLKRPYKCSDGKFVEFAAMCMESKPHAKSLTDEIGNVVNNVLQQAPAFQAFEKVTEQLGTLAGDDANEPTASPSKAYQAQGENVKPPPNDVRNGPASMPYPKYKADSSKERYKQQGDSSKERYKSKHNHKQHDHSKEHKRFKSNENDSNEHKRFKSNEHDSKEHKRSKSNENDSKERFNRKSADKSKEKSKKRHGNDDDSGSGEWHERMMQHREQSRQRHEQKHNNNWYIERGGSREQIRSGETRRR